MSNFRKFILVIGLIFVLFSALIGSTTAIANIAFMSICYSLRNRIKLFYCKLTTNKFFLLISFGLLLGLTEETLWYFGHVLENKPQPWLSLYDDYFRMAPVYLLLFSAIYLISKKYPITEKNFFICGGIVGYTVYFVMEGAQTGFQPISLLAVWEINNFLLNGFLIWMPLYISEGFVTKKINSGKNCRAVCLLLLVSILLSMAATVFFLEKIGYEPFP